MDNPDDDADETRELEKRQKQTSGGEEPSRTQPEAEQSSSQNYPSEAKQRSSPPDARKAEELKRRSPSILRGEANLRPNSELVSIGHSTTPRIQINDLRDIPEESANSLETTSAPGHMRSVRSSDLDSLEGESETSTRGGPGTTMGQYHYQKTRKDYEILNRRLVDKTVTTVIHFGEIYKAAYVDGPARARAQLPPRLSQETAEAAMYLLSKEMKSVARRINESKKEQEYTLKRINDLEVIIFKRQEAAYIKEILSKIPTEEDLKDMEKMKQLMLERKRLQAKSERLRMEIESMNKAMANADVIISECAAIKRPRKVKILPANPSLPDLQSSREIIGRAGLKKQESPPASASEISVLDSVEDIQSRVEEVPSTSGLVPDQSDGKYGNGHLKSRPEPDQSNGKNEKGQPKSRPDPDQFNGNIAREQPSTSATRDDVKAEAEGSADDGKEPEGKEPS